MRDWKIALPMYGVTRAVRANQRALLERFIFCMRELGWTDPIRIVEMEADEGAATPAGERQGATPAVLLKHWSDPDLLLSQACSYALMTSLRERVIPLATPCYRSAGCADIDHASRLVVRQDEAATSLAAMAGRVAALNQCDLTIGTHLLWRAIAPWGSTDKPFFSTVRHTNCHLASLKAVRQGQADIAAVDAVTWSLLEEEAPYLLSGLRTLQMSARAPGLPFIATASLTPTQATRVRTALALLENREEELLRSLRIASFRQTAFADYDRILEIAAVRQSICAAPLAGAAAPRKPRVDRTLLLSRPIVQPHVTASVAATM